MDPKDFETIEDEFNIAPAEPEVIEEKAIQKVEGSGVSDHLTSDYNEIRANLKDIIKRGAEAIDGILLVASETQQPRAYEVVASLIKSVADVNKDLLTMHKQMQDIKNETGSTQSAGSITNNSIFVGSTSDLQAMLKGRMEQIKYIDQ